MSSSPSKIKKRIIKFVTVLCILLLLTLVILPIALTYIIYDSSFNIRFETYSATAFKLEDFDGLQRTRYTFKSNDSQTLVGYKYYSSTTAPLGLIVLAHGFGGGGHNGYMDVISYFVQNGFWVFAYDATGNDESEGTTSGLQQALIDLDFSLNFVKRHSDFRNLPIMLFGHSWGGYAVSAVLNLHKDIKAVCEVAGFNNPKTFLHNECRKGLGAYSAIVMPYMNHYVQSKFSEYTDYTAVDGFANSTAQVVVVHAKDDDIVPFENAQTIIGSYDNDERFLFITPETGGHSNVLYSPKGIEYVEELNAALSKFAQEKGENFTAELKEKWIQRNLDRNLWADRLNYKLFDQIISVFVQSATE